MLKPVTLAVAFVATACATSPGPVKTVAAGPPACEMSANDRAWIDHALEAWRFTSREITGNTQLPKFQVIFFDEDCVMTSSNALSSPDAAGVSWNYTRHPGEVTLPNGQKIPVGRISFASGEKGLYYFVMSARSVWDAASPPQSGSLDVLVPVLLHEGSHVAQIVPYGPRLGAVIDRYKLPDDFSDDTMQHTFKDNAEFADSIKRETDLFFEAAAAKDDAEAKRLAREALGLLRERQTRWLVGENAYFVDAEDIWLTFEGAGQWAAFQWLVHPRGGAANYDEAMKRFATSRWWSQAEGFAVVMALERIAGPGWKKHAFGDGAKTVLQMMEEAVGPSPVGAQQLPENVKPPVVIHRVEPVYPPDLHRARWEGEVTIAGLVPKEGGAMRNGRIVSSTDPRFEPAALEAVSQWRWSPGLLNGEPVDVEFTTTVRFSLKR